MEYNNTRGLNSASIISMDFSSFCECGGGCGCGTGMFGADELGEALDELVEDGREPAVVVEVERDVFGG